MAFDSGKGAWRFGCYRMPFGRERMGEPRERGRALSFLTWWSCAQQVLGETWKWGLHQLIPHSCHVTCGLHQDETKGKPTSWSPCGSLLTLLPDGSVESRWPFFPQVGFLPLCVLVAKERDKLFKDLNDTFSTFRSDLWGLILPKKEVQKKKNVRTGQEGPFLWEEILSVDCSIFSLLKCWSLSSILKSHCYLTHLWPSLSLCPFPDHPSYCGLVTWNCEVASFEGSTMRSASYSALQRQDWAPRCQWGWP